MASIATAPVHGLEREAKSNLRSALVERRSPSAGLGAAQLGLSLILTPHLQSMWVLMALSARWLPEGMIY